MKDDDLFSAELSTVSGIQEIIENLQNTKKSILISLNNNSNCKPETEDVIQVIDNLLKELKSIKFGAIPNKDQQENITKLFEKLGVLILPYFSEFEKDRIIESKSNQSESKISHINDKNCEKE
jgi:diphthamide synthase (EF-2-diphthine--ammonia ligase)